MSSYIYHGTRSSEVHVTDRVDDLGSVIVNFAADCSIHMDLDTARKLGTILLAVHTTPKIGVPA